jgi:hypothetical protein
MAWCWGDEKVKRRGGLPPSEKERVYFTAVRPAGDPGRPAGGFERRLVFKSQQDGNYHYASNPNELLHEGERITHAYGREIEAATAIKYHSNAIADSWETLRHQQAAIREIEEVKKIRGSAGFRMNSLRAGEINPEKEDRAFHEKWKTTKHPQYEGIKMHPRLAETLDDAVALGKSKYESLAIANRLMTNGLFWSPVIHLANVAGHAFVQRGWDNINPLSYGRLARTTVTAVREVATKGPLYMEYLRAGGALLSANLDNMEFHKLMLKKMGDQAARDPGMIQVVKTFGRGAAWLPQQLYKWSRKGLWNGGDIMMMQRYLEEKAKGLSPIAAIRKVELDVPNYRIPSQVAGSRLFSNALQSPALGQFSRYHYGVYKSYGNILKNAAGLGETGGTKEQWDAVGQMMSTFMLATAVYPGLNKALQYITGNPLSYFTAAGPLAPLKATGVLPVSGKSEDGGGIVDMVATRVTIAPLTKFLLEKINNDTDSFYRTKIGTHSKSQTDVESFIRQMAQNFGHLADLGFAPMQAFDRGWKQNADSSDSLWGSWIDKNTGLPIPGHIAKQFLAQGTGAYLPEKAPWDPDKGHWQKGEDEVTQWRTTRKGAYNPIEFYGAKLGSIVGARVIKKPDPTKPGSGGVP